MTVQELITSTLILIQVIDAGDVPSSTESSQAFAVLNQLLSNWSAAGIPVYSVTRDVLPLVGATSYTIGPGGMIATARPVRIKSAMVVKGGVGLPVRIITAEEWVQFRDRSRAGQYAQVLYYDATYPLGVIALWPIPGLGSSLELYSIKPLTQFATLATTIDLPPGYEHALRFALGEALAPEYGSVLSAEVKQGAIEAKQAIAAMNAQLLGAPAAAPAA